MIITITFRFSNYRHAEEGISRRRGGAGGGGGFHAEADAEMSLNEFRVPRDTLLCIVAGYFSHTTNRIRELRKMIPDSSFKPTELLDSKAHNV